MYAFWKIPVIIQKYIAGRKSELASEIRNKGRDKMAVEDKKSLVARFLLPLARRDMNFI